MPMRPTRDSGDPAAMASDLVAVHWASHAPDAFHQVRDFCVPAVVSGQLDHVAHYTSGLIDLGVDLLDDPARQPVGGRAPRQARRELEYLGRQLHYLVSEIGGQVEAARSGRLIRLVFDAEENVVVYCEVTPEEYIVGTKFGAVAGSGESTAADRATVEIAENSRQLLSLPAYNLGGFAAVDEAPAHSAVSDQPSSSQISLVPTASARHRGFVDAATDIVSVHDLHYVAMFEYGEWKAAVDLLAAGELTRFFRRVTPRARREAYLGIGRRYNATGAIIDRALRAALGRRSRRVVFDVEEGAIYAYRVGLGTYLLGVTLDQSQVHQADQRMNELAGALPPDDE